MPEFRLFSDEEEAAYGAEAAEVYMAAVAGGASHEEAARQVADASVGQFTERLADFMQQQGPLIEDRRRGNVARLADTWGAALEAYYTVTMVAAEIGARCSRRSDEPNAADDRVSDALVLLNTRACQTSLEVHALLASGFPGGAYGRFRTLHELAVTAAVIAEYGRKPEHADLAERYLDHTHIEHYQQAQAHQRSTRHLGLQPFSAEIMRDLKREHDRCISRYGATYRKPYGWAAGLIGPHPTFAGLESKANMDVLRYLYVTGSHLVHASAHGLLLTLAPSRAAVSALAAGGPSDSGLAQPAMASLNALLNVTGGLVQHGPCPDDPVTGLNFLALDELRLRALRQFDETEARRSNPDSPSGQVP